MFVRPYHRRDAEAIVALFFATVRSVNIGDYTEEQVRAWAPAPPDANAWHERMSLPDRATLVVEEAGQVVAFAELLFETGNIAMFYCRSDAIRRGVGSRLYRAIEELARERGLGRLHTEASITARPFFEHHGYAVAKSQSVTRNGVALANFAMMKKLET